MRIITKILHDTRVAQALIRHAPKAVLPFAMRRRSRQKITLDTGEEVGLVLDRGTVMRNGDLLVADDGKFIVVQAAEESILRVTAKTPIQLTRAAYHLGNRHVLLEVGPGYLQLEHDPVLIDMLLRLGEVSVQTIQHPFEPDAGAYGGGHKHGHDTTFDNDYALAQAAYAVHEHDTGHRHEPVHHHDHSHANESMHDHPSTHGHTPDRAAHKS
ncbi:urease accessory protein UreE [Paralcaligenes ureilyticus]|uniref:Urease accessory protein UreE n=1 Tax=Paralcaligenes ureilyticus TaxID=627131 RepID=A0A4R3LV52_9BURK|nr:urease accessory protein UreE [Paralcaligenes ureilyticus]TCT02297.1 urease accessory protein [Paralcaligenes ureilyticus]